MQNPSYLEERLFEIPSFAYGLHYLEDSTKAPIGSARIMTNMMITDKGGISKRMGTKLLGALNTNTNGSTGFFNYIKSFGSQEIPIKAYGTELEYFHPTLLAWTRLMNGFTSGSQFGFKEHLVNTDNEDYVFYGNRTENYSRWPGTTGVTTAPLSGGETTVTIDSIFKPDIFDSGTSSTVTDSGTSTAGTATVLTDVTKTWTVNQWVGYRLSITSGAQSGQVATIISNTATTITIGALPGNIGASATYTIDYNATTTIIDTNKTWATGQWINFYVRITSGPQSGAVAQIIATTSNQIQFQTIAGLGTGVTYEIRISKYPPSGTLMINGTQCGYSAIATATTFTVASAPATPNNSPVSVAPSTYPANPKGNVLEAHYTRMVVGNVRSGLSRDSGGSVQGSQSTGSYYVSKVKNATDFTFAATRAAGEGDIVSTPYGGGDITDIINHEDSFYVFKQRYIESVTYSQDGNDTVQRQQLKTGFGSINRAIKGRDDVYFMTADNQFTSVGRVQLKDTFPQSENIGLVIKRLLDTLDFPATKGIEFKNRIFINCKADPSDSYNNRVLVFNQQTKSFEGIWELGAYGFAVYLNKLHYADARTPNIYEMFNGANDQNGTDFYPISSTWKSNWMNLTPKRRMIPRTSFNTQSVNALAIEGYIRGGTSLTFEIYTDFSDAASLSFTFGGTEQQFLDASPLSVFLGDNPLGLEPLGDYTQPNLDGDVHFSFIVYFPDIYSNFISLGVLNSGLDQYFEISRIGLALSQDTIFNSNKIKSI